MRWNNNFTLVRYLRCLALAAAERDNVASTTFMRQIGEDGAPVLMRVSAPATTAFDVAKSAYGPESSVLKIMEAQARAFSTSSGNLGDEWRAAENSFLELVRAWSLIGRIQSASPFLQMPANTRVLTQSAGGLASWTGERQVIPVESPELAPDYLQPMKIGAIWIQTLEFLRLMTPLSEEVMRRALVKLIAATEAESFINPSNGGIADVEPASVTYGISPISGTSNPVADLELLVDEFEGDLDSAVLVCSPAAALRLAAAFPNAPVGVRGGEVAGIPTVTSTACGDSSGGFHITLLDPAGILLVDEGVEFDTAVAANLEINDSNGGSVNLFHSGNSAIRAIRRLNWKVARDGAVATLTAPW